jgi:branched-chain amino acid transport system ATP-binding protein
MDAILSVKNIEVTYSAVILVLKGVSLDVQKGKIVSLLGANGAGKSTTLKSISGLLYVELGEVTDGDIEFEGKSIVGKSPEEIISMGIVQVMEGRPSFEQLTVEENLLVGAAPRTDGAAAIKKDLEMIYEYFPKLKGLRKKTCGYISGGEKQMQAIGRALMANPRMMLLDEPSLGLAPLVVTEVFDVIERIKTADGTSILLVEQNAGIALSISDHGYLMETGRIVMDDTDSKLMENEDIKEFYLGMSKHGKRKSYRDVKHYRRRKRWLG